MVAIIPAVFYTLTTLPLSMFLSEAPFVIACKFEKRKSGVTKWFPSFLVPHGPQRRLSGILCAHENDSQAPGWWWGGIWGRCRGGDGERERENMTIFSIAFKKFFYLHRKSSDDSWVSNGTYLELRKDLGFSKLDHPVLWWKRKEEWYILILILHLLSEATNLCLCI